MMKEEDALTRREFVRQVAWGTAALATASSWAPVPALASTIKSGMGYRTLGRTGLEISEVGLGAGSISASGANLIRAALSQGINFIETSSNYRNSQVETVIGQTVRSLGMRDKVVILTKSGTLELGSLKRLQTDYVDVYLCPYQANSPREAVLPALREALDKFKQEGKIRFTGLSTHYDYANICLAAIEGGYYDVLMFPVNFSTLLPHIRKLVLDAKRIDKGGRGDGAKKGYDLDRPIIDVREVLQAARRKKVGVVAMKGAQEGFVPAIIREQVKGEFAQDTKLSFHQFAYRYVLDQPEVSTVSIRMNNMLHLNEALVLPQKTLKG